MFFINTIKHYFLAFDNKNYFLKIHFSNIILFLKTSKTIF